MLMRRGPTRSMTGPPSAMASTSGVNSQTATMPVLAADPVVVSTNHGIAIALIRLPATEIAVVASSPANAGLRIGAPGVTALPAGIR
jgi:hypothetical protein